MLYWCQTTWRAKLRAKLHLWFHGLTIQRDLQPLLILRRIGKTRYRMILKPFIRAWLSATLNWKLKGELWELTKPFCQVIETKNFYISKNCDWIFFLYSLPGRSTVFNSMFSVEMKESATNKVLIGDFDFKTVQELLRYIYCEKVEDLKEVALNLLQAADKVSESCH